MSMKVRQIRRLMTVLVMLCALPVALVALGACKPACASGGMITADTDWEELFKQDAGDKKAAGPKKPNIPGADGGGKAKGNGGGKVKPCTGTGSGKKDSGKDSKIFGSNGLRIQSKTLLDEQKVGQYTYRIDVENPSPSKRPGQIHVQLGGKGSDHYLWRPGGKFSMKDGTALPRKVQKHIDKSPDAQRAIRQGLEYLGEK